MKQSIALLSFVLVTKLVFPQTLISETKLWSNLVHGSEYGSPYESFHIKMTIDSISSANTYGKVYRANDSLHLNWFLDGYINETDTGTIFYREKIDLTESLLYDFGVEEQDSILTIEWDSVYFYVDSIRTRPFGIFNELRKHIYLSRNHRFNMDIWIEGVGSIIGVLSDLSFHLTVGEGRGLLCFSENDSLKYESVDGCFLTGNYFYNEINDISMQFVMINNSGELIIEQNGPLSKETYIKIFDLNGRQLFAREISDKNILRLNSKDLSSGLYIFMIHGGGFVKSGKFIIY